MTQWYLVEKYHERITPVSVIKSTDKTLTLDGGGNRRVAISSTYDHYYPALAEAVRYLKLRAEGKIEWHERELCKYRKTLAMLAEQYPEEYGIAQEPQP